MPQGRIVWLASFPKSGNTWTRTVIDSYLSPQDQEFDINRLGRFTKGDTSRKLFDAAAGGKFQAGTVEEWLAVRPAMLRLLVSSDPGLHFVKTHSQIRTLHGQPLIPPELTEGAVYIMRNPFDVAPSFARHMTTDLDTAITRMVNDKYHLIDENGIRSPLGRWDEHIRTWTTAPGLTRRVMRYEDMIAEPEDTFRSLIEFLSLKVDFGRLRRTLRRTSFKALQKQEAAKGFRERPKKMDRFFASGQTGAWRRDLNPEQVARIREAFLPTLEQWYPELLEETAEVAQQA